MPANNAWENNDLATNKPGHDIICMAMNEGERAGGRVCSPAGGELPRLLELFIQCRQASLPRGSAPGGANNPDETYPPCQVIIQSMGGRQGEPRVVRAVQPCVFESIPESVSHARPPPARPPGSQFPPPIALASIQFVGYYLDSKKKKKQHKN